LGHRKRRGKKIAVLRGHDREVTSRPDGSRIVSVADNAARIWDAARAKEIAVLRGHEGPVKSAAFSPGGSQIVTASNDKTARILGRRERQADCGPAP